LLEFKNSTALLSRHERSRFSLSVHPRLAMPILEEDSILGNCEKRDKMGKFEEKSARL